MVVGIIGTLSALVLPNMKFSKEDGQATLMSIQKPIEKWRIKALKEGKSYLLEFNGAKRTLEIIAPELTQEEREEESETKKVEDTLFKFDESFSIDTAFLKNKSTAKIEIYADGTTPPFQIYIQKDGLRLVYNSLMTPGRLKKETDKDDT